MGVPSQDLRSLGKDPVFDGERVRPVTSGTFATRPSVANIRADSFYYATDTAVLYFANGSTWTEVSPATFVAPTFGTSLPGSPANGDYYTLTDSTTSPTYIWHLRYFSGLGKWYPMPGSWGFGTSLPSVPSGVDRVTFDLTDSTASPTYRWSLRYNAGSGSSYKWEFVGGSPATANVDASQTTASGSLVDLATAGPSFTLPRAGDYVVSWGAEVANTAAGNSNVLAVMKAGVEQARINGVSMIAGAGFLLRAQRTFKVSGAAASELLKLQYAVSGGTGTFEKRDLQVAPTRVS